MKVVIMFIILNYLMVRILFWKWSSVCVRMIRFCVILLCELILILSVLLVKVRWYWMLRLRFWFDFIGESLCLEREFFFVDVRFVSLLWMVLSILIIRM